MNIVDLYSKIGYVYDNKTVINLKKGKIWRKKIQINKKTLSGGRIPGQGKQFLSL